MSTFDQDTALEPIGELRWRGAVPRSWWIVAGPNGGFLVALAARAAQLATDWPPRSLTVHFLTAPQEGEIEVAATVTRRGRSTAFLRLEMTQDDKHVGQAIAVCAPWLEKSITFTDARPPALPDPETLERAMPGEQVPPLIGRYDMRPLTPEPRAQPPVAQGWIRAADPRPSDPILLAAMTDAFIPPSFFRVNKPIAAPTIELTVHFRGLPPEGEHPWIAARFVSRVAAGGVVEEDGELWSTDGRLLAQSRQLSLLREL